MNNNHGAAAQNSYDTTNDNPFEALLRGGEAANDASESANDAPPAPNMTTKAHPDTVCELEARVSEIDEDDDVLKAALIFSDEIRGHNEASLRVKFADAPGDTWLNPDREDVDDWTTRQKFTIYKVRGVRDNRLTPAKRKDLTAAEMLPMFKPYPVPQKDAAAGWFARDAISHGIKEGQSGNKGNDNVASVSLIVLDVDNKEGKPLSARNIRRVLKRAGLAALVMESFSSTPDCPKFRIVLFLLTPFTIGDDEARHALYKRLYAYLMKLFPGADPATKDVSRFWYDPSYPTGGAPGLCEFVSGNMLEANYLSAQVPEPERVKSRERVEVEDASPQRERFDHVIKALRGKYANASIMLLIYGTLGTEKNGGFEHPCPFWSGHASEKDNPQPDRACVISWDADVSKTGVAVTRCPHTTCKETHKYTTADYLFAALMEHRPEVLESIRAFGDFMREFVSPSSLKDLEAALATWAPDDDEIEAAFDEIVSAEGDQQKALARAFLKRVAVLPGDVETLTLMERLQKFLGMSQTKTEAVLKAERKIIKQACASLAVSGRGDVANPVPENPDRAGIIYASWDYYDKIKCARARFCAINNEAPAVFRRSEGGIVRLQSVGDVMLFEPVTTRHQWVHELAKRMKFVVDTEGDEADAEEPFVTVLTEFMGANDLPLPVVERIVEVPVFGEDGSLRTEKGYDAASKVYLNPKVEFRDVPDVVTDVHVDEALWWLGEDTRDFPFSDAFDGDEKHPVRRKNDDGSWADADDDGFPLPNPERGAASAVNFLAMRLQPFVREMIGGACPAYYIDKPGPGTGAGYLMNAYSYTLTAEAAEPQTVPDSDEEFRKDFASVLMGGAHTVFYDNLHDTMDSRHGASIITAEKIKPRILGRSVNIVVKVKATIVFAGNNGKFSPEMMRRIVPIRLDADLVNPAMDRGPDWFKHNDLDEWCAKHHANTVWACHVLVRNWLQKGKPAPGNLKGSHFGNTFGSYVRTIGGILEAAGVVGFLGNGRAFMDARADQANPYIKVAERLFANCPDKFGTSDVIDALKNPVTGDVEAPEGIAIDTRNDKTLCDSVGVMLATMASNVYDTLPGREGVKMKLVKKKSNGVMKYTWLAAA